MMVGVPPSMAGCFRGVNTFIGVGRVGPLVLGDS